MKLILSVLIAVLATTFIFFRFGLLDNWLHAGIAIAIVFVISFLFTTVAANAIAIVGTNPVSGMTLMTLILSSLILVSAGLSGTAGMTAALIIGGVVCTALAMAGAFISDLKIGYWLGSTPAKQEGWKFLGTAVSAATVAGVMMVLNKTYGFTGDGALVAPQANAMAAVIKPLMEGGATPWLLYFAGAALALVLTMIGFRARHVYSAGTERPAAGRRSRQLVCRQPQPKRRNEQDPPRTRNAYCIGIHRRRRADGRRERPAEIFRSRLVRYGMERHDGSRSVVACNVHPADRLFRPRQFKRFGP